MSFCPICKRNHDPDLLCTDGTSQILRDMGLPEKKKEVFRKGGGMEKKRSKGVTFWGYVYIIFSIIGLLGTINPQQQIKFYGIGIFFFGIVLCVASLICGIFILKLNESARKAAIFLGIISIILIPIYLKPMLKQINSEDYYTRKKQMIIEQMKPEYQQKALGNLEKTREIGKNLPIIIIVLFGASLLILELIPIYFFTRSTVKKQFR